jgi:hypothetical protein
MATTTNYGWDTPDDTDLVKDGALAMRDLGQDVDTQLFTALGGNYPGLRLIKKQTIGTGVSVVSVTGAFSANYDNYKIVVSGGTNPSAGTFLGMRLGTTNTGYYNARLGFTWAGATATQSVSNFSSFIFAGFSSADNLSMNVDLLQPFASKKSIMTGSSVEDVSGGLFSQNGGYLDNTTSYTSFEIFPNAGTLTGGTIYVYGYGAS